MTQTITAPSTPTFAVTVNWPAGQIIRFTVLKHGKPASLTVDQTHYDDVSFDDDEQAEYDARSEERAGRHEFVSQMTAAQMGLWVSMKAKLDTYKPTTPAAPAPAPGTNGSAKPSETQPAPTPPAPVCVPPATAGSDGAALTPAPATNGHTNGSATAGRRKIKDDTNEFIYAEVARRTRAYGMDELERKIRMLQETERKLGKDITILSYDIPHVMRQVMPEVTEFLWGFGFRLNESVWFLYNDDVESEPMQRLFAYFAALNTRFKGVMIRDGRRMKEAQIDYSLTEMSEKQRGQIKKRATDSLDRMLVSAHQSLIVGLDDATNEYKRISAEPKTDAGKEKTEKDRLAEARAHDNKWRTELRAAADALNLAVDAADRYDAEGNTVELLKGLRHLIVSRAALFNADAGRKGDGKGIEI